MDVATGRKSKRWLLASAEKRALAEAKKPRAGVVRRYDDGALLKVRRFGKVERTLRLGPNAVHTFITHADGDVTDLGVSYNKLTNIGCMVLLGWNGDQPAGNTLASNISTGVSATSITGTGSVWTASNLGTPTLGVAGWRVYAAPHTTTNPVVWGNVVSNTTNVLTIDQWWKAPAAAAGPPITGTTPTSGDSFVLAPGGISAVQFMALTTDSGAPSATDTTLASEITTNGCGRAYATFARGANPSSSSGTATLQKAFSVTGTLTAIHKMGLFTALTSAGADPMIYETALSADATVVNGDTLTVTWTVTLAGP